MPSPRHEQLVELFRNQGELAPALLELCADIVVAHERAELGSIDLSQALPIEYRADAVVMLHGRDDGAAAVVVEVQLAEDRRKPWTWPLYVAALRARHECPVYLLVIAPDARVARWARTTIALGHPGFELTPIVVGCAEVPHRIDRELARRVPELAVLAALTHPDVDAAQNAISTLDLVSTDRADVYYDLVISALPPTQRPAMESTMEATSRENPHRESFSRLFPEKLLQSAIYKIARAKFELSKEEEAQLWTLPLHPAESLLFELATAPTTDDARRAFDDALLAHAYTPERPWRWPWPQP